MLKFDESVRKSRDAARYSCVVAFAHNQPLRTAGLTSENIKQTPSAIGPEDIPPVSIRLILYTNIWIANNPE